MKYCGISRSEYVLKKFELKGLKRLDYERQSTPVLRSTSATKEVDKGLPPEAKPNDRDDFPRKSDFFHASSSVNHSSSWELFLRLPFALFVLPSRRLGDEARLRSALRSRPVNSTILRQCLAKRFTIVLWSFALHADMPMKSSSLSLLLLYQTTSLFTGTFCRSRHVFLLFYLASRALRCSL